MKQSSFALIAAGLAMVPASFPVRAGAAPEDTIGIEARAAFEEVTRNRATVLFIDVRDPVEIQFTGFTDEVDVNIPYLLADRTRWNPARGVFLMDRNPDFLAAVRAAVAGKGLDESAAIITLCRSGSERGLPSAAFLRANGFPDARYVIHGFQGDPVAEGPQQGMRLENGWQNSGLPWSSAMNPEKIHREKTADRNWLVIVSSASPETQAMAFILSQAEAAQGTRIRILLCDDAAELALRDSDAGHQKIRPPDQSPREMLAMLLARGATIEVCGIFLPTRGYEADSLLPGIGVATPPSISRQISQPETRVLTF